MMTSIFLLLLLVIHVELNVQLVQMTRQELDVCLVSLDTILLALLLVQHALLYLIALIVFQIIPLVYVRNVKSRIILLYLVVIIVLSALAQIIVQIVILLIQLVYAPLALMIFIPIQGNVPLVIIFPIVQFVMEPNAVNAKMDSTHLLFSTVHLVSTLKHAQVVILKIQMEYALYAIVITILFWEHALIAMNQVTVIIVIHEILRENVFSVLLDIFLFQTELVSAALITAQCVVNIILMRVVRYAMIIIT